MAEGGEEGDVGGGEDWFLEDAVYGLVCVFCYKLSVVFSLRKYKTTTEVMQSSEEWGIGW